MGSGNNWTGEATPDSLLLIYCRISLGLFSNLRCIAHTTSQAFWGNSVSWNHRVGCAVAAGTLGKCSPALVKVCLIFMEEGSRLLLQLQGLLTFLTSRKTVSDTESYENSRSLGQSCGSQVLLQDLQVHSQLKNYTVIPILEEFSKVSQLGSRFSSYLVEHCGLCFWGSS